MGHFPQKYKNPIILGHHSNLPATLPEALIAIDQHYVAHSLGVVYKETQWLPIIRSYHNSGEK